MMTCGYPCVYMPNSPHAGSAGWVYEHIIKAEEKLGRPLKDGEVVHHRDKDKTNNNLDNLMVFTSNSDHTSFHKYNCDDTCVMLQEDGSFSFIDSIRRTRCKYCGSKKEWDAIACRTCYDKYILPTKRKVFRPSREDLKQMVRSTSFNKIAKMYGVRDNTIRKWCKFYKIPYHRKEIESISDASWALV